jgi:hypothetical protein
MDPIPAAVSVQQHLNQFLDLIVSQKYPKSLDTEFKESIKADLMPRLERFITLKTLEETAKVSSAKLQEFQSLIATNPPKEQISTFIQSTIPDYPEFLSRVLLEFRNIYIGTSVKSANK